MKSLLLSVLLAVLISNGCGVAGGGANFQVLPDSIEAGQPGVVVIVFSVWGSGGPVKGRYKDIAFHYRLVGYTNYKNLSPEPTAVPSKYDNPENRDKFEAYRFTIPPYPPGTKGEIEFYYESTFDGNRSRTEGLKRIKVL